MVRPVSLAFVAAIALGSETVAARSVYVGDWAVQARSCGAIPAEQRRSVYHFGAASIAFPSVGCEEASFRLRAGRHIVQARGCYGEDIRRPEPFTYRFSFQVAGDRMRIDIPELRGRTLVLCRRPNG